MAFPTKQGAHDCGALAIGALARHDVDHLHHEGTLPSLCAAEVHTFPPSALVAFGVPPYLEFPTLHAHDALIQRGGITRARLLTELLVSVLFGATVGMPFVLLHKRHNNTMRHATSHT